MKGRSRAFVATAHAIAFVFVACSVSRPDGSPTQEQAGLSPAANPRPVRADEDNLTRDFAVFRRSQVHSIDYDLALSFQAEGDEVTGHAVLDVELETTSEPLSIDLDAKRIDGVRVDGRPVTKLVRRNGSFDLPAAFLQRRVRIEIDYAVAYDTEGQGIQRVVDPEDGSIYVYTDFEPFYAHNLFPCFDQPDIKGSYTVSIEAPRDWLALANQPVAGREPIGDRIRTRFTKSPPLSSYLVFVGAGPFSEWTDRHGDLPLHLYARKSLARYVDAEKIFATALRGLRFYEDYFDRAHPFDRFALVFVPEFAWGGMENPGAITLNERMIFRGPVPRSQLENRDNLILHEMAHLWFGDLVTMRWWNDLWLNESFASYLASVAQDRALATPSTWLDFFEGKAWGYWQDQLVTTHPIETEVRDVRSAKANVDGITYAKGAAALQQLHHFVGEDSFRESLRAYFRRHAFQNTERADFIAEVARTSQLDLAGWSKAWLQSAGPNRVRADWGCDAKGRIERFVLIQAPNVSGALLPHRTQVALFRIAKGDSLELFRSEDVRYSENETPVPALIGVECPGFVHANQGDRDYALFGLDARSLEAARPGLLGGISDPLTRLMLWHALDQRVRDAELSLQAYFEIVLAGLAVESDPDLLGLLLGGYSAPRELFRVEVPKALREQLAPRLEAVLWRRVLSEVPGSSEQLIFFDYYVSVASSPAALARLAGLLGDESAPPGITLDQDRRWAIVASIAALEREGTSDATASEERRDPTTAGQRNAYAARVAVPRLEAKQTFWSDLEKAETIPFSFLRAGAARFHDPDHPELSEPFVARFFERIEQIDWQKNDNLVEIYLERLFPRLLCSSALREESERRLLAATNLIPLARRAWREANDELGRCIAIRKRSAS